MAKPKPAETNSDANTENTATAAVKTKKPKKSRLYVVTKPGMEPALVRAYSIATAKSAVVTEITVVRASVEDAFAMANTTIIDGTKQADAEEASEAGTKEAAVDHAAEQTA